MHRRYKSNKKVKRNNLQKIKKGSKILLPFFICLFLEQSELKKIEKNQINSNIYHKVV